MSYQIGPMRERVVFEERVEASDIYGNVESDRWAQKASVWQVANVWQLPGALLPSDENSAVWAYMRPVFGREQVEAGRNESTMLGTLVVRSSVATRQVDPAYRVRFITGPYNGMICNIRSIVPTPDRRYVEYRLEQGVAPE